MIRPDQVNPAIKFLTDVVESTGKLKPLHDYTDRHIKNRTCSNCESKVEPHTFKQIDEKEYFISGLCNKCQVYFFKESIWKRNIVIFVKNFWMAWDTIPNPCLRN